MAPNRGPPKDSCGTRNWEISATLADRSPVGLGALPRRGGRSLGADPLAKMLQA